MRRLTQEARSLLTDHLHLLSRPSGLLKLTQS
jgi:hypothetical protein